MHDWQTHRQLRRWRRLHVPRHGGECHLTYLLTYLLTYCFQLINFLASHQNQKIPIILLTCSLSPTIRLHKIVFPVYLLFFCVCVCLFAFYNFVQPLAIIFWTERFRKSFLPYCLNLYDYHMSGIVILDYVQSVILRWYLHSTIDISILGLVFLYFIYSFINPASGCQTE